MKGGQQEPGQQLAGSYGRGGTEVSSNQLETGGRKEETIMPRILP